MDLYTAEELIFELRNDKKLKVLFVEGLSDLGLWRKVVPELERDECQIYCSEALVSDSQGGAKNRLVDMAEMFEDSEFDGRIMFFLDADCDRLLNIKRPSKVVLTDFRDIEAYSINKTAMDTLCLTCMALPKSKALEILSAITIIVRPIGFFRLLSEKDSLGYSFTKALSKGLKKYIKSNAGLKTMNKEKFLTILMQNRGESLSNFQNKVNSYMALEAANVDETDNQICQGKDLGLLLAEMLDINADEAVRHIRSTLALSLDILRAGKNLKHVENWVRA